MFLIFNLNSLTLYAESNGLEIKRNHRMSNLTCCYLIWVHTNQSQGNCFIFGSCHNVKCRTIR